MKRETGSRPASALSRELQDSRARRDFLKGCCKRVCLNSARPKNRTQLRSPHCNRDCLLPLLLFSLLPALTRHLAGEWRESKDRSIIEQNPLFSRVNGYLSIILRFTNGTWHTFWLYFLSANNYENQNESPKVIKCQLTKSETQRASIQQKPSQEEGNKSTCRDKFKNHTTRFKNSSKSMLSITQRSR